MSFTLRLLTDLCSVEPGSVQSASVEIINRGDTLDTFEITCDGLDPNWIAVPVPSFSVDTGDRHSERVLIKPPRESDVAAGSYPFEIKVRSLNTGESHTVQGVAEVKPYYNISVAIDPRKGFLTPFKKSEDFTLTVINLGNSEQTIQFYATDSDDACVFGFEHEKLTLVPGVQRSVKMSVTSGRRSIFSSSRLTGFTVTARDVTSPASMGSVQGQLEQRALASPGAAIGVLLALLLLVAWVVAWPKRPELRELVADTTRITTGAKVRVEWRMDHGEAFELLVDGTLFKRSLEPRGSCEIDALGAGDHKIEGYAISGDRRSPSKSLTISVSDPPEVPKPQIVSFDIEPKTVDAGGMLKLSYRLRNAESAQLFPVGTQLPVDGNSFSLTAPTTAGVVDYKILVTGKGGLSAEETIKVTVKKVSAAKVISLTSSVQTATTEAPSVVINWQTVGAAAVTLNDGKTTEPIDPAGAKEFVISSDTTFKLTVTDAEGTSITKTITVKFKATDPDKPVPPIDENPLPEGAPVTPPADGGHR